MLDPENSQVPDFYSPDQVSEVWRVPYQERAVQARKFADQNHLTPAADSDHHLELVIIDVQNTFCIPGFELFVGGKSGRGAVEDNQRLVPWIYQNLEQITGITATLDTHHPLQIFHPLFLIDRKGNHPSPSTIISKQDVNQGKYQVNPAACRSMGINPETAQQYLKKYVGQLAEYDRYQLTIWPYHAMLGGIGHALVSAVEEAVFFHSVARHTTPDLITKGTQTFTEAYSAIGPEVLHGPKGEKIGDKSTRLLEKLQRVDRMVITGQAKSHCVAFTVSDLLDQIEATDPDLAQKVYLLEDCTSPVVIPEVVDFSTQADQAFKRFEQAGMHLVRTNHTF